MKRWLIVAPLAAMAAWMLLLPSAQAAKINPLKFKGCLACHHQYDTGKDDGVILGNWVNRSRKAKTLTVKIGPKIQILKWDKDTKVTNAPSIHKLKKGLAVRIVFKRKGGALYAQVVVAKPAMKLPRKMIVSPKQLFDLLKAGKVAKLVDSRPPFRYVAGTIPGAINIPFPKMDKMIGKLPRKKDALVVFFCQGKR
ncbi:MAG: rhodanese-like domain-containing protein [Proteobacteria bacterium]|nr:rhodanese-like domain-containing protein [Pseudomonadota bacterium]